MGDILAQFLNPWVAHMKCVRLSSAQTVRFVSLACGSNILNYSIVESP